MKINTFQAGPIMTNCYVINEGKDAVIIDPAAFNEQIDSYIESNGFKLHAVLLTHAHFDHTGGAAAFKKKYGAKFYVGEEDEIMLFNPQLDGSYSFGLSRIDDTTQADVLLCGGETLKFGELTLEVIATPGHSIGGVCYYQREQGVLFAGDTLFYASCGRTDLYGGSAEEISYSIREKLFALPDSTLVYCGHGEPTQIGFEKKNNPFAAE